MYKYYILIMTKQIKAANKIAKIILMANKQKHKYISEIQAYTDNFDTLMKQTCRKKDNNISVEEGYKRTIHEIQKEFAKVHYDAKFIPSIGLVYMSLQSGKKYHYIERTVSMVYARYNQNNYTILDNSESSIVYHWIMQIHDKKL